MSELNKMSDKSSETMDMTSSHESVMPESSPKVQSDSVMKKNKKHRRGRKRKKCFTVDTNHINDNSYLKRRRNNIVLIRPENVPKAPENSTQFIIDDHEDCKMYFSFDYLRTKANNNTNNNCSAIRTYSPKTNDNYEIYDLEDTSRFYLNDFEMAFNSARNEELMKKDRNELIEMCQRLENKVTSLQRRLLFLNPSEVLDDLQDELIHLQEENQVLRQRNRKLKNSVKDLNCDNSYGNDNSDDDHNDSGNVMHCDERFSNQDYEHRTDCSSCNSDSDSSSSSSSTTASTHSSSNDRDMSEPIEDTFNDHNRQVMTV